MKAGIEEFGQPVYGLAGTSPDGTVSQYGPRQVTVRYELGRGEILEVTTGRHSLGGTRGLMMDLIARVVPLKPRLPWHLSLSERNVFVPVSGTRTQFHLVEASTGDWVAAGGFRTPGVRKRHLLLNGTSGVNPENLSLAPVEFDFTDRSAAVGGSGGWVSTPANGDVPEVVDRVVGHVPRDGGHPE